MATLAQQTGLIDLSTTVRLGVGRLTVGGVSLGILAGSAEVRDIQKKEAVMAKYPKRALLWEIVEVGAIIKVSLVEHSGVEITKFNAAGPYAVVYTYIKPNSSEGTVTLPNAVPGDELTKQFLAGRVNTYELEFRAVGSGSLITWA